MRLECRSEETRGADRSAPIAIILALSTSAVFGLGYILALMFSIQAKLALSLEVERIYEMYQDLLSK